MALILVQLAQNKNQHAATLAEETATRINRGDVVRVLKNRDDVGIRQSKQKWIKAGRTAADFSLAFVIVEITDMTDAQAEKLVAPFPEITEENPDDEIVYNRRWGFEASAISPARQAELITNGEIVTNRAALTNVLVDDLGVLTVADL